MNIHLTETAIHSQRLDIVYTCNLHSFVHLISQHKCINDQNGFFLYGFHVEINLQTTAFVFPI